MMNPVPILSERKGTTYQGGTHWAVEGVLIIRLVENLDHRGFLAEFWTDRFPETKAWLGEMVQGTSPSTSLA